MNAWKRLAVSYPRTYLFLCWLILGLIGTVLGAGETITAVTILGLGYVANIIWMYRL